MQHFHYDGVGGFRSRFDDIRLVHEFLEELPDRLGVLPAAPPFLLPYYNGVIPEDAGISSFLFLVGGHVTLHTFSFRESFYFDLVTPRSVDTAATNELLRDAFPCAHVSHGLVRRGLETPPAPEEHPDEDFGPHLFLDIVDYAGPRTMDGLFELFDHLPELIGMTPIMRPYVVANRLPDGTPSLSAMTMIAESHISLHVFPAEGVAYFDLFSCRFFDPEAVVPTIEDALPGHVRQKTITVRGRGHKRMHARRETENARTRTWLDAIPPK